MRKIIAITMAAVISAGMCACTATEPEPTETPMPTQEAKTEPKQTLEYRLDLSLPNPNGDWYETADEEFAKKVNEIFAAFTNPQNDYFENVLGLYQYVSQNINLKEDGAQDSMQTLLCGSGSEAGINRLFQYLMNQIGVESYMATASNETDCWVIAKMPDGYYHFDPAEDAERNAGQSLQCFAMNDAQRWDGGRFEDWSIGRNEDGEPIPAPKNEKETYSYLQNVKVGYGMDVENDCLFFADVSQDNELVRYYYQSGLEEALGGIRAGSMIYYRGFVYFSDLAQRNQLFKMDVLNGQTELLDSVFVTRMMLRNGTLIYFDDVSSSEKGINLQ